MERTSVNHTEGKSCLLSPAVLGNSAERVVDMLFRADNRAKFMISENIYGLTKKIACVSKTLILNCIYKNATDMVTELLNFSFIFVLNKNNLPCK